MKQGTCITCAVCCIYKWEKKIV